MQPHASLGQTRIASLQFGRVLASCGVPREPHAALPARFVWRLKAELFEHFLLKGFHFVAVIVPGKMEASMYKKEGQACVA